MQLSDQRPALEYRGVEPCSAPTPPSLRETLREATSAAHARLHLHTGLAAIQDGTITRDDYRALLARLYGFHVALETSGGIASERSAWLREDLAALQMDAHTMATIPRCTALGTFATPERRLGALYVMEGATLGGRHLARQLEPLLGSNGSAGRRFFLGHGADTSTAWNAFLGRLTLSAGVPAARTQIVAAAVEIFGIFEEWLRGWRTFKE
jgi:heme oxygenase